MIYKGTEKDIVLSIPTNTVEIKISLTMYEDGKLVNAEQILSMETIKECENLFEETVAGDYPVYALTEKGLEELEKYFD